MSEELDRIVEGVKAACGESFIVSMRLALKSYIKGYNHPSLHGEDEVGRTVEEGLTIARLSVRIYPS